MKCLELYKLDSTDPQIPLRLFVAIYISKNLVALNKK